MNEDIDNINDVGMLREKIEAEELTHELKTIFGGYSKNSVLDYIKFLNKQQQIAKNTFEINLKSIYEEKEKIKKENENLINRLNKLETSYDLLFNNVKNLKFVGTEFNGIDFYNFRITIHTLESKIRELQEEKTCLENKIKESEKENK